MNNESAEPATNPAIWVVDDDASIRWVVSKALSRVGVVTREFTRGDDCLAALESGQPEILVTDLRMPGSSGQELIARLNQLSKAPAIIVISAHSDLDTVLEVYAGGAVELLAKPFDVEELVSLVLRLLGDVEPKGKTNRKVTATEKNTRLVGQAPVMQDLFRVIGRVARTQMPVLVIGESGTGKELVAQTLHNHSPRRDKPFVALNTAAIPGELLESELFGHERGAFTGAHSRRIGRFEQANGGTLFLDEIGDMPIDMQTRLLRVLSEGEFFRVGGHESVHVDVRIIAATHQDLQANVTAGRFREDLYHRLDVVTLKTPALRERKEDIPVLVDTFLEEAAHELDIEPKKFTAAAMRELQTRQWPGNVRELRNFCRRISALVAERQVGVDALDSSRAIHVDTTDAGLEARVQQAFEQHSGEAAEHLVGSLERMLIIEALQRTNGHKQEAAKLLGWGRNTLTRKLQRYGLE
jgi:two-component system nitrogen regulation response regulator GlnG